ncbi:MAG: IreB family regulatory phosphoprotein [Selenomonadaceae bacterium]|nr:IreB family regulatory phosphoprotein [Selenomonadaceae bacterium]
MSGDETKTVSDETRMFRFGVEENRAQKVIKNAYKAMTEKGYNPVHQLVGYLLSGDPAYVTSYLEARSMIRKVERDELLEELVRSYLERLEGKR